MNFLSFPSLHLISLFAPTHKIQKSLHFTSLVITFISSRIKPWKYGKRVCFSEFHFHIRKLVRDKLKNPVFGVRKIILSSNMTHGIILKNFEVFLPTFQSTLSCFIDLEWWIFCWIFCAFNSRMIEEVTKLYLPIFSFKRMKNLVDARISRRRGICHRAESR